MRVCPELSRLPRAPRWSSVKFIRRAPGSVSSLLGPGIRDPVDPTHPAFGPKTNRNAFPLFEHDAFRMRAYPLALLEKSEWTPREIPPLPSVPENKKQVDMHLSIATSMKNTSKLAIVRVAIARRVKHALELIIARGANSGTTNARERGPDGWQNVQKTIIVFDDKEAKQMGPRWVLNGWMYIFHPTLRLYRMPYYELVSLLRSALQTLHAHGMFLEHRWTGIRARQPEKARLCRAYHTSGI
ncbi:hypothetical protein APHAL10511_007298 [Amanita phalloides]|nr:hypothetical protein APHAL10511_007298 [Amanita phalloides]